METTPRPPSGGQRSEQPPEPAPVPSAQPDTPTPPPRLLLLDVLRGVAILGTLAVNIWIFHPVYSYGSGPLKEFITPLTNGKFLSMLAMMFGVGLAVQFRAAAAYGRKWPGRYRWRQVLLLVEGALHALLLFAWDVLMAYALAGLLVVWLLRKSERVRSVVMWSALAVNTVFYAGMALLTVLIDIGWLNVPVQGRTEEARAFHREADTLYMEGGYLEQVASRWADFLGTRLEAVLSFPLVVFLFLLGVKLYRAGVFDDDERGRRYRKRMMRWGLGLGLPLCVLGSQIIHLEPLQRYGFAVVLMLGYVGLTGWLLERVSPTGQVVRSLSAVGRAALTCYVLQNLLGSVIFYGWGFGLASYLETRGVDGLALDVWILGAWLVIALVLVSGSRLWLRRFDRGPLETAGARLVSLVPESFPRRGTRTRR